MITKNIRSQFLKYFKDNQHTVVPSSPVVPHDDPTLLFNNAGMNQFKDVFLGKSIRDYKRAVSSQKCIRVGGKHNDLENVGHTRRHLTFFEMLGNFSFGDYFKPDAIRFAWEVSTQVFGFDPEKIWPTVFRDDDEAFELWTQYVPAERITRFGEKENFWAMGDTGPCGPCSELLYDRGSKYGSAQKPIEDVSGERFLEFWNLVFMQYNRLPDGISVPLPKPSIDTGAGLERVVSLKMDVDSVFETDALRSLIAGIEHVSNVRYDFHDPVLGPAFRVIADHLRCLTFAIADGVQPSNVDRGYVLRKVLRRAVRYGRMLGLDEPFLSRVMPYLMESMGSDYPEIIKSKSRIEEVLTVEEEAFIRTLRRGGNILNTIIEQASNNQKIISGDDAFKLKDTYGFPFEEIALLAKDANLTVDSNRYQALEQEARERSRSSAKATQQIASNNIFEEYLEKNGLCEFLGYNANEVEGKVTSIIVNGEMVESLQSGMEGMIVLNKTPFYAEMGGQVGDVGVLANDKALFKVTDTQAPFKGVIGHIGTLEMGHLAVGDSIQATFDDARRQKIANNHTATHLLHWALHKVLGEHIKQAGSVVDDVHLRFDFSHHKALTQEEIQKIEDLVNEKIRSNSSVEWYEIPYDVAQKREDIKQFFGEKYGNKVRVIDIDFSKELCGGTHTQATGNIGLFRIAKESSIAAGIRRIEAVTGHEAESMGRESDTLIRSCASLLKAQPHKLQERIEKLLEEHKQLQQEVKQLKKGQLNTLIDDLLSKIQKVNDVPFLAAQVTLEPEDLRTCADEIIAKNPKSLFLALASDAQQKCSLLIRVTEDLVTQGIKANEIIKEIGPLIDGSGGGKPNSAQAGGKAYSKIPEALETIKVRIELSRA